MTESILQANLITMGINLVYAIVAMAVGLAFLKFIDRVIFPEIDFIAEIKKGNLAAAIVAGTGLLFLALVLSSAVR